MVLRSTDSIFYTLHSPFIEALAAFLSGATITPIAYDGGDLFTSYAGNILSALYSYLNKNPVSE